MLKYFIRLSPTVSLHTLPSLEVDLGATAEARKTHSHTANGVMLVSLVPLVYWMVRMTNPYPILGPLLRGGPVKDRTLTRHPTRREEELAHSLHMSMSANHALYGIAVHMKRAFSLDSTSNFTPCPMPM